MLSQTGITPSVGTVLAVASPSAHSFSEFLFQRSIGGSQETKGERTKDRIIAAAARLLETGGYHQLRIVDIAAGAEVSPASIYQYFNNKTEITVGVMTEFLKQIEKVMLGAPLKGEAYLDIYDAILRFVKYFQDNAGLMRALHMMSDDLPEIGNLTIRTYAQWRQKLAQNLIDWSRAPKSRELRLHMTTHALSVMGREFLYDVYIRKDPALETLVNSPEEIAELLAEQWYRAALGGEIPGKLKKKVEVKGGKKK